MIKENMKSKIMKGVLASTPAWNERKDVSQDTEVWLNILTDCRRTSTVYGECLDGDIITDCRTINTVCYVV
jgi:hypothetical protein